MGAGLQVGRSSLEQAPVTPCPLLLTFRCVEHAELRKLQKADGFPSMLESFLFLTVGSGREEAVTRH